MGILEFLPIPEIKRGYKTKEDKIVIVRELLDTKSEKIVIVEELQSGKQYEWNATEWNANIDSAISEAMPLTYDYDPVFKSPQDLILSELDKIRSKRLEGKELNGKFGQLKEFLWTFAGVDKDLLRMCPTDHARLAGFGGTILWGGIISGLSFGYGFYMFTESLLVSIIIGIVCFCLTIFLDGFITNTMYSDGEVTVSKRELLSSMPRVILAIILGIVISAPLQIKIFEGKINDYIINDHYKSIVASSTYEKNEERIETLNQELQKLNTIIEIQEKEYENELAANRRGIGPVAKEKELRIENTKRLIIEKSHQLNQYSILRDSLINVAKHPCEADFSFSSKIEALSQIASFKNNESKILPIANLLICFMFIVLCLLPIINKMLMADGVYEKLLKHEEELTEKLTRIHIVELENKLKN
ncbi:MAG: DUF4407 domain-containing protein [Prevotellaceae bacterium]|nr:DUF4407 domain-containing protein [Prevotellaceae bacterium]